MGKNTIEKLMDTAMTNIKDMVDVNTIVGEPVETIDGTVIIPVSKVSFGFAAGGGNGDSPEEDDKKEKKISDNFAGGTGGGVMLNPMAFLVVNQEKVRLLPVTKNATVERLINIAPEILEQIKTIMKEKNNNVN